MMRVRRAQERGHANHGWLDSYFTFSFADYYDPAHLQFRSLRVINEDRVAPRQGFGMHPHRDMEIFTYIVSGELAHKDSMGHVSSIKAGQVQKITAGTGILHSEFNASDQNEVHMLQIWIVPDKKGLKPVYEEFDLPKINDEHPLTLIGSVQGGERIVHFNQNIFLYRGVLKAGQSVEHPVQKDRGIWLQMIKGNLKVLDDEISAGDGFSLENHSSLALLARNNSEFLLFDLA